MFHVRCDRSCNVVFERREDRWMLIAPDYLISLRREALLALSNKSGSARAAIEAGLVDGEEHDFHGVFGGRWYTFVPSALFRVKQSLWQGREIVFAVSVPTSELATFQLEVASALYND